MHEAHIATGKALDDWGALYGVSRDGVEPDAGYRSKILSAMGLAVTEAKSPHFVARSYGETDAEFLERLRADQAAVVFVLFEQVSDHPERERLAGLFSSEDGARAAASDIREHRTHIELWPLDRLVTQRR